MTEQAPSEELIRWKRRLAAEANNRAWALSEHPARSASEDEEMLHAAHAAMFLWAQVGDGHNKAHAAQLLAHVHAALGHAESARYYLSQSAPAFSGEAAQPWERALAHVVAAHVAAVSGDGAAHAAEYGLAVEQIAALEDAQDREILQANLRVIPAPR
jgi:hypothetical protein